MKSILIVDDTTVVRQAYKILLRDRDVCLDEVDSGEAALAWLREHDPPDGMLLDIDMSGIDGISTLRTIKADPNYRTIKVLMCSTKNSQYLIDQALGIGAECYIVKPFSADVLYTKLEIAGLL